jgi:hypothetical protein
MEMYDIASLNVQNVGGNGESVLASYPVIHFIVKKLHRKKLKTYFNNFSGNLPLLRAKKNPMPPLGRKILF